MIRTCDAGHSSLFAANWKCPWCEIERLRADNQFLHKRRGELVIERDALKEAVKKFLRENDPEGFGCACTPERMCGPCRARLQQQPLRTALKEWL